MALFPKHLTSQAYKLGLRRITYAGEGWAILTVREATARKVKELAHRKGLTVDEFINELMSPSGKASWSTCPMCGPGSNPRTSTNT